jgi:hypothetical protein
MLLLVILLACGAGYLFLQALSAWRALPSDNRDFFILE